MTSRMQGVVLLGAGGHAKVVLSLLQALGLRVIGVCDPQLVQHAVAQWRGLAVLGGDEALQGHDPAAIALANGIGQIVAGTSARVRAYEAMRARGFRFPSLVHPSAVVDASVRLADGVQVMAGAVLQADVECGENSIVNTRASIDHDCIVGRHVHIAPGATLSGAVRVEDRAFVGAGATVVQGLQIGADAFLCAGALLRRPLASRERWPAPDAGRSR